MLQYELWAGGTAPPVLGGDSMVTWNQLLTVCLVVNSGASVLVALAGLVVEILLLTMREKK